MRAPAIVCELALEAIEEFSGASRDFRGCEGLRDVFDLALAYLWRSDRNARLLEVVNCYHCRCFCRKRLFDQQLLHK